jgi:hypothetical protein
LWTAEDRAWAMALLTVEAENCPECGQPWVESSNPDNEFAYDAHVLRCHACTTSAKTRDAFEKRNGDARGMHVLITKRE